MNINTKTFELMPYTPMYKEFYLKECRVLEKTLKSNLIAIHHIGSTAIPTVSARPILDVLVIVHTLDGIKAFEKEFLNLGLVLKKEDKPHNKITFERISKDGLTQLSHITILEKANPLVGDYLDFKDYLNAEEEIAKKYDILKRELQRNYKNNPELYKKAKDEFIQTVLKNINNNER